MKWKESLKIQTDALNGVNNNLDVENNIEEFKSILKRTRGFHYFTGIGKNGYVAAKVASTFNSLGIRSLFIDPVNTLHGDMNIFTNEDIVIVISKSGETEELIRFIEALRRNNFENIISVTSKRNSTIERLSKFTLFLPINHEGDHLNLAPVTSSIVYMAVLQAIAVELSSEKGFDKKQFVKGHPGGTLGKTVV